MADRTSMSLPAAKVLRARADRVIERAALSGTPRQRYLREQRRRLAQRLLPTLALVASATGAAAGFDLFQGAARSVTLVQGLTATLLAALALGSMMVRKNYVALMGIAVGGGLLLTAGWAFVIAETGGVKSPYAFAVPMGIAVFVMAVPLLPWHIVVLALAGGAAFGVAAPHAPPSLFIVFLLIAGGGFTIARSRRKRSLVAFRRLERLGASLARLRRVQDQLVVVEKLEALRVLVGGMAHELNNALAVSLASTEQIARVAERDPAAAAQAAVRAQKGLVRIRGTIDRLKRFALAEEGPLETADLCAMLDFALESAIGRAQSGIAIQRAYEENLPPINVHVAGLAEALFQIARNAVDSMPKGGTLKASVRGAGDRVVLAVQDEGQGISPQRLAKVFDPFYARENAETFTNRILSPMPGRSGLGLSAVYGLVSALGGTVDIRSIVGEGTEVSISLPARLG